MVENDKKKDHECHCPVNEWARHALYVGGMIALHAGIGASATVANKTHKCPVSEWARHAIYAGGAVVLAVKGHACCNAITSGEEGAESKDEKTKCPVNEWVKHAIYIAGVLGVVSLMNARKK